MDREPPPPGRAWWPKRVGLAASMALIALNVWTGGPLLALWIGSRLQEQTGGSLTIRPETALATFAALGVITLALVRMLRAVSGAYDRAAGTLPGTRRRASWLGGDGERERPSLTVLERILVVVVVIAAIAFEIWFAFYSTSPIDGRSGRSSVPLGAITTQ